jgi:hypothetical protein
VTTQTSLLSQKLTHSGRLFRQHLLSLRKLESTWSKRVATGDRPVWRSGHAHLTLQAVALACSVHHVAFKHLRTRQRLATLCCHLCQFSAQPRPFHVRSRSCGGAGLGVSGAPLGCIDGQLEAAQLCRIRLRLLLLPARKPLAVVRPLALRHQTAHIQS